MTEALFYQGVVYFYLAVAVLVFVLLFFLDAPYGRHVRKGWGPPLPFMWGWILMEVVSPLGMLVYFLLGSRKTQLLPIIFLSMWLLHYLNRTFVYAYVRRDRGKPIPLLVVLFAVVFNLGNAYLNGRYLFSMGPEYSMSWLMDPRFLIGVTLFFVGWGINLHADHVLLHLRKPGESGYKIPKGGMYHLVSCPNYFGEILEWCGWAIATWSVPGLVFAIWTVANLLPRAVSHHRWYKETFDDYPTRRKALIPFLL